VSQDNTHDPKSLFQGAFFQGAHHVVMSDAKITMANTVSGINTDLHVHGSILLAGPEHICNHGTNKASSLGEHE
jgi:hypothetical protein